MARCGEAFRNRTVERMQKSGPQVQVVEFPGVGHAPWLMSKEQIAVVHNFLLASD